ncbi:MAG TPA: hypothetical protein V6C97_21930 [Oculatellaceae cyanobacterium]
MCVCELLRKRAERRQRGIFGAKSDEFGSQIGQLRDRERFVEALCMERKKVRKKRETELQC